MLSSVDATDGWRVRPVRIADAESVCQTLSKVGHTHPVGVVDGLEGYGATVWPPETHSHHVDTWTSDGELVKLQFQLQIKYAC